ncbi:hypothetical protein JCM3775_007579 [Rhodotorula graminis]
MKCKALEIRWHETKPIFSADLHSVPPSQHIKPAHPYAKLGATGVDNHAGEDDHARSERLKREHDSNDRDKSWRLATCGGDNNVRLWLVTPRPHPDAPALSLPAKQPTSAAPAPSSSSSSAPHANKPAPEPKVEYLATLSQHTGVVNCVRFAPVGEMLASAGDDGNILIWVPGESSKKMGETDEDRAYEKESWRVRSMIRSMSGKEIYDLAWSPSGDRLLAGSVDHTATIYDVLSGAPLYKIAEHTNYVQGVCWDPRGELIATQSSDRSMHVYKVRDAKKGGAGGVEVHAVGKNSRLEVQRRPLSASSSSAGPSASSTSSGSLKRARKPSEAAAPDLLTPSSSAGATASRPGMPARASSTRSDVSDRSTATTAATTTGGAEVMKPMDPPTGIPHHPPPPPPRAHSHSRRSSTSGSQPSQSPRLTPVAMPPGGSGGGSGSLSMRSPSPAPPLPAVMLPLSPKISPAPAPAAADELSSSTAHSQQQHQQQPPLQTQTIKLYGDANSTPFFRRLCWSTDGSLLLTPAGLWEDPYAAPASLSASGSGSGAPSSSKRDKKDKKDDRAAPGAGATEPRPTVYIYSRANVARPPVAHLPGHRTTSIAIRFCPVLFDLRSSSSSSSAAGSGSGSGAAAAGPGAGAVKSGSEVERGEVEGEDEGVARVELGSETQDVSLVGLSSSSSSAAAGDKGKARALDGDDKDKPQSMFDLPYRMVYAVATLDSVYLYDTQQAGPIAMFGNLHYAPFTDLTWSTDGQTLVISSQDGYCSVVAFEPGELGTLYADQRPWTSPTDASAIAAATSTAPAPNPSPRVKVEPKPDSAGALPSLFAKVASSSSSTSAPTSASAGTSTSAVVVDLTQSDSASSSPVKRPSSAAGAGSSSAAGARDGAQDEDGPPPEKKQKKRVAPTLVRPLGS